MEGVMPTDSTEETLYLALVLSLPSRNATERMRAWRTLKTWGCAVLRDGVYLLPFGEVHQQRLTDLGAEIREAGGQAEVLRVLPQPHGQEKGFRALFDRSVEYATLLAELDRLDPIFPDVNHLKKAVRGLRRRFDELTAIDFFPGPARVTTQRRLAELESVLDARLSPGEPNARPGKIERLDRREFQGRLWSTRSDLWVDRLASAWLILRFIDPAAHFVWFAPPEAPPPEAPRLDFEGARFSHVGTRITFETLMASFALEETPGLRPLAHMIHALDIGEPTSQEAPGFLALLRGMKSRLHDDDALLDYGGRILDDYHLFFSES